MKKQRHAIDPEHIGFKDCFGTTTLSFTNALTGVAGAWLDSIPMIIISGQIKRATCTAWYWTAPGHWMSL